MTTRPQRPGTMRIRRRPWLARLFRLPSLVSSTADLLHKTGRLEYWPAVRLATRLGIRSQLMPLRKVHEVR
jgi:hypothetical protein